MSSGARSLADSVAPLPRLVRLLVVEDHEQVRKTICDSLRREKSFEGICDPADAQEAVRQAEKLQPDVVVFDISMPTGGAIEAAVRILWVAPKKRVSGPNHVEWHETLSVPLGWWKALCCRAEVCNFLRTLVLGRKYRRFLPCAIPPSSPAPYNSLVASATVPVP